MHYSIWSGISVSRLHDFQLPWKICVFCSGFQLPPQSFVYREYDLLLSAVDHFKNTAANSKEIDLKLQITYLSVLTGMEKRNEVCCDSISLC